VILIQFGMLVKKASLGDKLGKSCSHVVVVVKQGLFSDEFGNVQFSNDKIGVFFANVASIDLLLSSVRGGS